VAEVPIESTAFAPFGVTGDSLTILGEQRVPFQMGNVTFNQSFLVCKLPTSAAGILGSNFLRPRQARLDLGSLTLRVCLNANFDSVASRWHESSSEEGEWRERRGLITHVSISQNFSRNGSVGTRDTELVRKSSSGKFGKKTPSKIEETSNPDPHTMQLNDSEAWTVISRESVVLQPRAKHGVPGKVLGANFRNPPCLLCVEPAHVPIEGRCVARGAS
jgi:hypothetical protein